MLPRSHRLHKTREVNRVRQHGRSWRHPLVILLVARHPDFDSRFAVVASRRVGHAVARNRTRRCLREIIRLHLSKISPGWDCVFIIRREMTQAAFGDIEKAVLGLLTRSGLLGEKESTVRREI